MKNGSAYTSSVIASSTITKSSGLVSKILPLTSLRFFAAFYVVLFHTGLPFIRSLSAPFGLSGKWLSTGYISVSFFFALSGYVLAFVYLKEDNGIDKRRFWVARFARIYPLFFITLTVDAIYLLQNRIVRQGLSVAFIKTAITYLANVFMLQAWILKLGGIDDPNWSLSVETLFYLLFPWLGKVIWRLSLRLSIATGLSMYFFNMFFVWAAFRNGLPEDVVKFNPVFHLAEFGLGILLAKFHLILNAHYPHQLKQVSLPVTIFGAISLVTIIRLSSSLPVLFLHDGLLFPIFGCIILSLAGGDNLLTRLLSFPGLVVLGEGSYALYLLHIPVWHWMLALNLARYINLYPIYLLACLSLSVLSFYKLEIPLREKILDHFASRVNKDRPVTTNPIAP